MKAMRIAAAAVVVVALMSGCSSSGDSPGITIPSSVPNPGVNFTSVESTPPTSARLAPMASVGGDGKLPQGAAAAPMSVAGKIYTQDMYNNFAATVVYETTKNEDMSLLETLDSAGAPLGYQYGRDVCGAVEDDRMSLNTLADNIHNNVGLTLGGAQAVIAGAARHLCGIAEIRGYLTYFDSQVANEQAQIHKLTHAWVDPNVVGWSSRVTCDYLSYYGNSAGLRPALESFMPFGTQTMVLPFPIKDAAGGYSVSFDAVITTVASFWCPIDADLLGPSYYHA